MSRTEWKNCRQCGQLTQVADNSDGHQDLVGGPFCCDGCRRAYNAAHPNEKKSRGCAILILILIILIIKGPDIIQFIVQDVKEKIEQHGDSNATPSQSARPNERDISQSEDQAPTVSKDSKNESEVNASTRLRPQVADKTSSPQTDRPRTIRGQEQSIAAKEAQHLGAEERLNKVYFTLRERLSEKGKSQLQAEQRIWIKNREGKAKPDSLLWRQMATQRTRELEVMYDGLGAGTSKN